MPELREVFEMVTKQTEPDLDAWRQQEQRQRRTSRNRKWGALAIAATIAIVAVVVVIRAVDEGTGTQPGGQATGTSGIPPLPWGALEPRRYAVSITRYPAQDYSPLVTIDVPEGYEGFEGFAVLKPAPSQTGLSVWAIGEVYADACKWKGTQLPPPTVGSANDLAAALASQEGLRVSTPTDATIDGFAGTYMERTEPAGTETLRCDEGVFRVWLDARGGERDLGGPGQLDLLWILDVDGVPLVIDVSLDAGTSAQVRAELVQMVESIRIDPR